MYCFRRAMAAVMSTLIRWFVWALVSLLASMFREIALRMPDIFSVRVPRLCWTAAGDSWAAGVFSSPRARLRAEENGVNIAAVPGSGPDGLVIERDVNAYMANKPGLQ